MLPAIIVHPSDSQKSSKISQKNWLARNSREDRLFCMIRHMDLNRRRCEGNRDICWRNEPVDIWCEPDYCNGTTASPPWGVYKNPTTCRSAISFDAPDGCPTVSGLKTFFRLALLFDERHGWNSLFTLETIKLSFFWFFFESSSFFESEIFVGRSSSFAEICFQIHRLLTRNSGLFSLEFLGCCLKNFFFPFFPRNKRK